MSVLTLVRHGQASYLSSNYDQLSALGERQARVLGEYWVGRGLRFDRVLTGTLQRQLHTERIVAEVYHAAGLPWPAAEVWPEFDECQAIEMMRRYLPVLREENPRVAELTNAFEATKGTPEAAVKLDYLFAAVAREWSKGEWHSPGLESWPDHCERVRRGLDRVRTESPRKSRGLIVTSSGVIAAAVKVALALDGPHAMELIWMSRNTSWSEFLFTGPRFSLSAFNSFPHLIDAELLTYR